MMLLKNFTLWHGLKTMLSLNLAFKDVADDDVVNKTLPFGYITDDDFVTKTLP